ncbi:hypothetical protein HYC85_013687 [Camellia sinensis]|uniref:Nucleotide-diphospho-sugar transferase domain-containing protein n=1 Tax=Camellia sinensis TaxID=4442 RepID=A0A7J7H424_CAMSI|nr:hypothetical protein HYC85_013687 [Camellia sinensis]
MWFRNPFSRLVLNETIDLQISVDHFNGDQWSEANYINTGFYMIRSNNKTIALFDEWHARKDNSTGMKEQDVLQKMMHEGVFRGLRLRVKFWDTLYFSGFCRNSNDVRVVVTVHSNCCRQGRRWTSTRNVSSTHVSETGSRSSAGFPARAYRQTKSFNAVSKELKPSKQDKLMEYDQKMDMHVRH